MVRGCISSLRFTFSFRRANPELAARVPRLAILERCDCADVLKPLCRQVGIPVGTLYAFRHGRVSKMQEQGVNEKIILTEVGPTTLRMTRRYTHFTPEQRRATAEKLAS
jgi:integrase